ncbi:MULTISPECIES: lipocalin family protein [Desulfococcus]|uniref:Outer membrane lipoprotein Blc n=1 Tax=Desulfococcus multivorans DSM 2059 TaxID=1121405 RepID=S7TZ98_DESML|nr:lipocalin family protein [Desulfococcus multivorans]EPR42506.1 Lipocalin/cytosolic fatty-acid binding protein domain containing protein [Desulfococcus multivorans DSM 2059]
MKRKCGGTETWIKCGAAVVLGLLLGCVGPPEEIRPVKAFDAERYLGVWYEIARLDHWFERNLTDVSATYSLRNDGGIDVLNRGFDVSSQKWKIARGRAYAVGDNDEGSFKVSFFGPFYGGYHVIDLDRYTYEYALVCGSNRSYLWILARNPQLPEEKTAHLIETAKSMGFDTSGLIFVAHKHRES